MIAIATMIVMIWLIDLLTDAVRSACAINVRIIVAVVQVPSDS